MVSNAQAGAKWWRVDFHAHSPSSYDFGAEEGSVSNERPSFEEWLLAYMSAEIDALVIADHNSHEGINLARAALQGLRERSPDGFREIVLFPGVEITTAGGTHLIAVFDPGTPSETINGLLHQCEFTGDRGTSNRTTLRSFLDVFELIQNAGGIPIPAHVDTPAGLLKMSANELETVKGRRVVRFVEVSGSETKEATRNGWLPVMGSDAHHLDASGAPDPTLAKYPGSHFSWVKMEAVNKFGLQAAFTDGRGSVLRSTDISYDPNNVQYNTVESLSVRHRGFEQSYSFGPWLNAVIGGRGTGKSSLIELMRLALNRFDELPEALAKDLAWFSPSKQTSAANRFWDSDTEIEVHYSKNSKAYKVLWQAASPDARTISVFENDEWIVEEGAVEERFPALLVSQKQIFEMAKNPQAVLGLIDGLPQVGYADWNRAHEELRSDYRTKKSALFDLRAQLSDESVVRGNLRDAEEIVATLTQRKNSQEAQALERLKAEERYLERFDAANLALLGDVKRAAESYEQSIRHIEQFEAIDEVETNYRDSIATALEALNRAVRALQAATDTHRVERNVSNPRANEIQRLQGIISPIESSTRNPNATSGTEGTSHTTLGDSHVPNAYEIAVGRVDELKTIVQKFDQQKASLTDVELEVSNALKAIRTHRRDLFERRDTALKALSSDGVQLKVFPSADKSALEEDLRSITQRPSAFDSVFSEEGLLSVLQRNPRDPRYGNDLTKLRALVAELKTHGRESTTLRDSGLTIGQKFITHMQTLDLFELELGLDLWEPDDLIVVEYQDKPGGKKIPIDRGSPGQRTAALLAVMLKLGDQPLILDQPEDDIDNLLIYELVVQTLRAVKTSRQVIVATHNANIVINGDAEHVSVMQHGAVPELAASGAIQDPEVRDLICRIMEGGEAAFQSRYEKLLV